ncbi:glycosyltransferase involved in cell wall biosynthesis [Ulvibacter sp. MAR_2010_11]|uniref:glycosyltransferase n=1 Tax=Ulvibacter sp. MAR_2010_11 TaxID=1250229 RepID=UPI000C2C6C0C|nr:glycosyltransferase [Ulvibacter sp. MAR_2010_11]PKA82118.1 glycosyltransferase involved in cell wall biosynthesis [Ulvibacter sp. MAR_2010_11]
MRIGLNPQKNKKDESTEFYHQVVVPVYIPNEEGYFEHGFTILKHCLESLFRTCHPKSFLTIVNNGSHPGVEAYLEMLYKDGKIHELIHTGNIGKINAVFKGISGHAFPLVTVTDADVLFLNGWQKATYEVFNEFPKTGFVSPTPLPKLLKYHTYDTIVSNLFSKKLQFTNPINPEALQAFATSIGNKEFYKQAHLNKILTLKGKSVTAAVGGGHFVATFRQEVFANLRERYSPYKLGGESVRVFLDQPVANKGYWRLSTETNFAFHMGNVAEPWMQERLANVIAENDIQVEMPNLKKMATPGPAHLFKRLLFEKFLVRGPIWRRFLRYKGLTKTEANEY